MKLTPFLILSILLLSFNQTFAKTKPSKAVHHEMHTQLLANAKNGLDKSVLQNYLQLDIEEREELDPIYGDLSEESIEIIDDLLKEANSHMGTRYMRGGKGPKGFDCSGFTSYVYRQFGYSLNASSSAQFSNGVDVEEGDLRPGDLVFFTSPRSGKGIGHVGIVVSADNEKNTFRFIHAAISGGIQINNSTAPYYAKRYKGARRIITE